MSTPNPYHESPFAFHIAVKRVRLTLVIEEKNILAMLIPIKTGFAKSRPGAQRPTAHGPRRPSGPAARRPIGPRPTARDGPAARRPGGPAARWPSLDFPVFLSSGKSTRMQWTTVSLNSFTI